MWYHVSKKDLGERATLTPRVPENIGNNECHVTPRISFCPTIEQCFVGLVGYGLDSIEATLIEAWTKSGRYQYTVYVTNQEPVAPSQIGYDYHITGEMWRVTPTEVMRVGYPDRRSFEEFRRFRLLDSPLVLTKQEEEDRFRCMTEAQHKLQERWYDRDENPHEIMQPSAFKKPPL